MNWQLMRLSQAVPSRWRNGGGVTRELAASPAGSADWTWRISVAEVAAGGPFSRFPGVKRWFAVLAGAGVDLKLGAAVHRITGDSAPFEFDGDVPVACELIDGATQDLNLMVRGERVSARMVRLTGPQCFAVETPRTIALYAAGGPARVRDEPGSLDVQAKCLAWREAPAGTTVEVTAPGALWMEITPWA